MGNRSNVDFRSWLSNNEPCTEIPDLTDEQYFGEYDRFITAHKVISYNRDPAGFFDGKQDELPSDALIFGAAAHKLLLEGAWAFAETFHVYQYQDVYSTSGRFCGRKSKKWATVCEGLGCPPDRTLHSREYELLRDMHLSFTASPDSDLIVGCKIERCIRWCMLGLRWQCKIDAYDPIGHAVVDLKTIRNLSDAASAITRYGYDLQAAVYAMAYEELYGEVPDFYFVFIEKEAPHRTRTIPFDRMLLEPLMEDVIDICDRMVDDINRRIG